MEEEKKNKKTLYLVLGVTLLLVLAIGGVYAYFAARATNSGDTITGRTLDIDGSTLTIAAERVDLDPDPEPVSDNLVPANFGVEPTEMTTTQVNRALDNACAGGGYTGCHVWKITATTTTTVPSANIKLNLSLQDIPVGEPSAGGISNPYNPSNAVASPLDYNSDAEYDARFIVEQHYTTEIVDKSQWSYVVYTGTDSSASTILNKGYIETTFPSSSVTIDIHNGASLIAGTPAIYYVMVYLNNENSAQNDGETSGTTDATAVYNGTVILEAMGGQVKVNFLDDAVEYITNLYTSANKSTATVNNITYTLAPSVGLMRDQFGSSSSASNTGNLRYYGADPDNYVWLGDTYTSVYTIPGTITSWGYSDFDDCISGEEYDEEEGAIYCTEDVVRQTGDKKLWRIVGIFNGRIKLVSADPISTTGLSWDTSASTVNGGWGINQWGESGSYEGSDLMRLLNPGYESALVNNSLYWNKTSGTVYTGYNNATTDNVSFVNTGLTAKERSLIDSATWYTGAYDNFSYVDAHYTAERGSMGKICSSGTYCNDAVTRTSTWTGKVGLIYPSDLGYGTDLRECNQTLDEYYNMGCVDTNWLSIGIYEWTVSPRPFSVNAGVVFGVNGDGSVYGLSANNAALVRPAVYLKSSVTISEGDGSQSDPFVFE